MMKCQHERCGLDWEYHGGMDHDFVPVAAPDKLDEAEPVVTDADVRLVSEAIKRGWNGAQMVAAGRLAGARELATAMSCDDPECAHSRCWEPWHAAETTAGVTRK